MSEVIAFADMETLTVAYLDAELDARNDTATVATKVPNPRPDRLVRVTRVGGTRRNLIADSVMLTFECWDLEEPEAFGLCRLVRALIWALPGEMTAGTWIYRCLEVGGPQFFPDPETSLPRYQFTVQLDTRGEAI